MFKFLAHILGHGLIAPALGVDNVRHGYTAIDSVDLDGRNDVNADNMGTVMLGKRTACSQQVIQIVRIIETDDKGLRVHEISSLIGS